MKSKAEEFVGIYIFALIIKFTVYFPLSRSHLLTHKNPKATNNTHLFFV